MITEQINLNLPQSVDELTVFGIRKAYEQIRVRSNEPSDDEWQNYRGLIKLIEDNAQLNLAVKQGSWYFVGTWDYSEDKERFKINLNIFVTIASIKSLVSTLESVSGLKWKFKFGRSSPDKCDSVNIYCDRGLTPAELDKISKATEQFARQNEVLTDEKVSEHLYIAAIPGLSEAQVEEFLSFVTIKVGSNHEVIKLVREYLDFTGKGLSEGEYLLLLTIVSHYSDVDVREIHNELVTRFDFVCR